MLISPHSTVPQHRPDQLGGESATGVVRLHLGMDEDSANSHIPLSADTDRLVVDAEFVAVADILDEFHASHPALGPSVRPALHRKVTRRPVEWDDRQSTRRTLK